MSIPGRRRRALVLLSLALACGGLAASEVRGRVRAVEQRVGRPVPVVTAARDLPAGTRIERADLAVREVPARYAPADAPATVAGVTGAQLAAPLARGAYVTAAALGADRRTRPGLRRGERAVELAVAGGAPLADAAGAGARVDVVITTDPRSGSGRTFLALQDVELLSLDASSGGGGRTADSAGDGAAGRASATATLRVTLRQAVYLSAAENFAREVRLLPRPAGDRRAARRSAVSAGGL